MSTFLAEHWQEFAPVVRRANLADATEREQFGEALFYGGVAVALFECKRIVGHPKMADEEKERRLGALEQELRDYSATMKTVLHGGNGDGR